ncbi:MAG: hypothetical protein LBB86_03640, partial [Oscillospiraceae bacterium]|jgi:hypothetical protein|nr:hypothetical protein [Oscillospiraceae bacterium]
MGKGLKEIEECFKGKANAASYLVMQLVDRKVIELKCTDYNEYSRSLERIFAYADKGSDDSLTIGNTMRRVLEAFAAFSYKKDIGHISTNDPILSIIPENLREYFKNLMYKLVLHGESHYFDRIKGMNDYGFSALLSDSEKKRTARDILCFIYLLNKQHVLAHLSPSAENGIKTWIDSISPSASAKEAPEAEEFAAVKSA